MLMRDSDVGWREGASDSERCYYSLAQLFRAGLCPATALSAR